MFATAVQPDTFGNFLYNIWEGESIKIEKDILGSTDVQPVINGQDAFLTRKVLLNDASFLPSIYQMVAMDVNADGVISAGDVSQINQRAVLMIPEYRQAWNYDINGVSNGQPSKDWLFLDTTEVRVNPAYGISATYPLYDGAGFSKSHVPVIPFCQPVNVSSYGVCPLLTSEAYYGVLLGDVNGNYSTTNPNGSFRIGSNDVVAFDLENAKIENGYVNIPVSIASETEINALDFSFSFDESRLTFQSIVSNTDYMEELSNFNTSDRKLRFTSNSVRNYELNKSLVYVRFALHADKVGEADFSSVTAYLNGEKVNTQFARIASSIIDDVTVKVYPNPAINKLNVEVSADASMQLLDVDGRQVFVQEQVNAYENNEINLDNIASGIYMLKVYNDSFLSNKKVVIKK